MCASHLQTFRIPSEPLWDRPYGFSGKAPKRFNTFGGSLGGPVIIAHFYNGHNRTFFFFTYEGNRRRTSVNQQFLVPTVAERNGDLSGIPTCDSSGHCVPGPVIAPASISSTAKALLQYYPLLNVDGQSNYNYEHFQSTPASTDGADVRLDQTINSKQSMYARFSRKNITSNFANPLLPNDTDSIHNRSLLISHTYTITPRLLNEFRFGFTNVITNVNFGIQPCCGWMGIEYSDVARIWTVAHSERQPGRLPAPT